MSSLAGEDSFGSWSLQDHLAGHVRPMLERDIPQVADLYVRVYGNRRGIPAAAAEERLAHILFRHPWYHESLPSLVFENSDGFVVGCIGVLVRPMILNGRRLTAAVSHSFMVEPGSRSGLAGLHLARRFLTGAQDLSLAEGSEVSRRIWEGIGGSTSLLYSLCWTRPLQPSRYVLAFLRRRGLSAAIAWTLKPLCRMLDAAAPHVQRRQFRLEEPAGSTDELLPEDLPGLVYHFAGERALWPEYTAAAADWMLKTLTDFTNRGPLMHAVVRNRSGDVLGWYLYYLRPEKIAEVVQIGADGSTVGTVLDHLFYQASRQGAIAVSGQVDPVLFKPLSDRHCVFHHDGNSWMLVHSRHPEVMQAIHSGKAQLTRMEGEWWISATLGQQ